LLINSTHQTVIRLQPSLTVTDDEIDSGCGVMADVILGLKP
jgi:acetylornithine/N-succinyldiaminopimelate aminotransferase